LPAAGGVRGAPAVLRGAPDVVVVGAGAFGGWTALWLRRLGASVTLVDMYGPGNSRATSGGETRGVRSSYGEEKLTWVRWANLAIERWKLWDEEWRDRLEAPLFYTTGDVILRTNPEEPMIRDTRAGWDRLGVPYEVLTPEEVRRRWPVIDTSEFATALYEPNAGVVRARRACEAVARAFEDAGGRVVIGRAALDGTAASNGGQARVLVAGEPLPAGRYVFACGPWLGKVFPDVMANRLRTPLGHVFYYGPPPGDQRFNWPNLPSYNVPGVTGWPALPPDNRGFRVRTGGQQPSDPDESVRWVPPEAHERPREVLRKYFPVLADAPVIETRACHYESSVSRNFIIDLHPAHPNVWIAGAGSAEAFKQGPVLGDFIAHRVLGETTDLADPAEFALPEAEFEAGRVWQP
ncbi:MAG: NAD(P)/FAD-dependent oxidoreductase, partial [Longimicrobiales bacterium]